MKTRENTMGFALLDCYPLWFHEKNKNSWKHDGYVLFDCYFTRKITKIQNTLKSNNIVYLSERRDSTNFTIFRSDIKIRKYLMLLFDIIG